MIRNDKKISSVFGNLFDTMNGIYYIYVLMQLGIFTEFFYCVDKFY